MNTTSAALAHKTLPEPQRKPLPKPAAAPKAPIAAAKTATTPAASSVVTSTPKSDLGLYGPQGLTPAKSTDAKSAGSGLVASGGHVTVDVMNSDSGYENQIYWSSDNFATRHLVGTDNHTATVDLGQFAAGTKIEFGIVNGANQFFRTGAASANSDNVEHAHVSQGTDGQTIGFEDLNGGGDRDFNDAIIHVSGLAAPAAPSTEKPTSVTPPKTAEAPKGNADNRSGLGDGTNPGQGAGRDNSPNVGTLNPNQTTSHTEPAKPKAVAPVKKPEAKPTAAAADKNKQLVDALYKSLSSSKNEAAASTKPAAAEPASKTPTKKKS